MDLKRLSSRQSEMRRVLSAICYQEFPTRKLEQNGYWISRFVRYQCQIEEEECNNFVIIRAPDKVKDFENFRITGWATGQWKHWDRRTNRTWWNFQNFDFNGNVGIMSEEGLTIINGARVLNDFRFCGITSNIAVDRNWHSINFKQGGHFALIWLLKLFNV